MKNKNVFILPTTEASQLYLAKKTNSLGFVSKDPESMEHYGSGTHNQHIYITNKDPYERYDWVKNVTIDLEIPFQLDDEGVLHTTLAPSNFEKIVLTSDPKLVSQGIEEISIDFLRFLKDKKLDEINIAEIEKTPLLSNNGRALYGYKYKPIILPNESKKHIVVLAGEDAVKEEVGYNMKQEIIAEMEKTESEELERGITITHVGKQETVLENKKLFTDYPITELGDEEFKDAPIRECELLSYDNNKYCYVKVEGIEKEIKRCYIYPKRGTYNEVDCISIEEIKELLKPKPYQQDLFNYLQSEFNVIALQSEMKEIENIVNQMPSKNIYSEQDMREMYNKSCGLIGLGSLDDQTENDNRFIKLIDQIKNK